MGEAKKRGTKEERTAEAKQRSLMEMDFTLLTKDAIYAPQSQKRAILLDIWMNRLKNMAANDEKNGSQPSSIDSQVKAFREVLSFIWDNDYSGACHSTSAILYMLLAESDLEPTLCIGEVCLKNSYFDHSWVELDGKVMDAAVSFPLKNGTSEFAGGPVFRSIDLSTNKGTDLSYGAKSTQGLDDIALVVLKNDLSGYHDMQVADVQEEQVRIWNLTVLLAANIGLTVTTDDLKRKYGSVKRALRGQ